MQLYKIVYIGLLLSDVFLLPELVKNINRSVDSAYFLVDVCKELVHHVVYASFLRLIDFYLISVLFDPLFHFRFELLVELS